MRHDRASSHGPNGSRARVVAFAGMTLCARIGGNA